MSPRGRIPLAVPVVGEAERANLNACIDSTFVSSVGPFVSQLESLVAAAAGARTGVATSAGTTGLHAALVAVGVGRDDLVILPSFTFIASANAISHCGAQPWLFDIDLSSWTLDLDQVERELEAHTVVRDGRLIHAPSGRRVAALMPVYTLGNVVGLDRMRRLAQRFALPVVADAAAALGATEAGRPFADGADLSVVSFNGNKIVTAGGGGMIVGNDAAAMKLVRHLTTTARVSADYSHDMVGFNYRMTNLQAAVGCAQMDRLAEFVAAKRAIRERYADALGDLPGVEPFPMTPGSNCWFSGVVLEPGFAFSAAQLCEHLGAVGIEARTFWKPVHLQGPYRDAPRAAVDCAEGLWSRVVTLPCSTNLTEADQGRVIDAVRAALT